MTCETFVGRLRRASYKGVNFFVETDDVEVGRRLVVHEFPHREAPYIEDMGGKAVRINVDAYVTGDNVEAQVGRLLRACASAGAGSLSVPMGRYTVQCESGARQYDKDRLGYLAVKMSFVKEGSGAGPFAGLNLARAIEFAVSALVPALGQAFFGTFRGLGVPGFVADASVGHARTFAASLEAAIRISPLEAEASAALQARLSSLYSNAPTLMAVGDVGDTFTLRSYKATGSVNLDTAFVQEVFGVFEDVRKALPMPYIKTFLEPWLIYESTGLLPRSATAELMERNRKSVDNAIRSAAAAQYIAAIVNAKYADRPSAKQARADAAEYLAKAIDGLSGWETYDAAIELRRLRGEVANYLTRIMTDLAPVVVVTLQRRLPALAIANRIYGSAERAGELVARNRVKNAAFMPVEFEALLR